jgi:hypothetical protein
MRSGGRGGDTGVAVSIEVLSVGRFTRIGRVKVGVLDVIHRRCGAIFQSVH